MLYIRDTGTVPNPHGWCYEISALNITKCTRNYVLLYPMVVEVCKSNGVPIPSEEDVKKQMCERLRIPCYEGTVPLVNKFTLMTPAAPRLGCCGRR